MENNEEIIKWIINNVDEQVVPCDEGNAEGLVYNLVHLLLDGKKYEPYNYLESQDEEIKELYKKYKYTKEKLMDFWSDLYYYMEEYEEKKGKTPKEISELDNWIREIYFREIK